MAARSFSGSVFLILEMKQLMSIIGSAHWNCSVTLAARRTPPATPAFALAHPQLAAPIDAARFPSGEVPY
jgi:hypothetical protein